MNLIKEIGKLVHDDTSAHFIMLTWYTFLLHYPSINERSTQVLF